MIFFKEPKEGVLNYRFEKISVIYYTPRTIRQENQIKALEVHIIEMKNDEIILQFLTKQYDILGEDMSMQKINKKLNNVFDDVIVGVDKKWSVIHLYNYKAIQKRWIEAKEYLLEDHKGIDFMDFLNTMDSIIENEKDLISFICRKEWFGLFLFSNRDGFKALSEDQKTIYQKENNLLVYEKNFLQEVYWESEFDNEKIKYSILWQQ